MAPTAPGAEPDPDAVLAALGTELAAAVAAAVPGWVERCVAGALPEDAPDRAAVLARAAEAGRRAGEEVGERLRAVLGADVDDQPTTPLQVVRGVIGYPTEVLRRAGVPPVERDGFARDRLPDDRYGLAPASLAGVDPSLAETAMAWGAAKAVAHRHRHRRAAAEGHPESPR